MNFDRTSTARCIIPEVPPADPRCEDAAFSLANPTLCNVGALIIKPAVLLFCVNDSIQFKVYEYQNGIETLLTDEVRFTSSNLAVFAIGVLSGSGTALAAGVARIIATHEDGRTVTSEVEISATATCCDNITVASAVVIDASRSMTLAFGGAYATRLNYAKTVASLYAGLLGITSAVPDTGGTGGDETQEIYYYTSDDPNGEIVPDNLDLPAMAYKLTGDGPIWGWSTTLQMWV